ncbi:SIS domain-containing protein [Collinsella sp. AGMB00827]|uniref:SIS domain-containing protein n=1 Tax=Collinsella ureilytica TaxID=2869515 RepID=A0ABS7MKA4_9ACTN|nr:SIS domain-containing protein [Collinsella urealyticum]MBY4797468.1 SIS domain-containing protein [Collinsella urealyticum]
MFEKTSEELKSLGADITTAEIMQQPELWRDALSIYADHKEALDTFLAEAASMDESRRLVVIFAGAGTSDYVGDTVAPYLNRFGDTSRYEFKAVATTDLVSAPQGFLNPDDPTLLVSFARSGNSPESLAAVEVVRSYVKNARFLNITCAPEGKLARESEGDSHAHTILIPRANDGGFAMTGSFSCMSLMTTLIFDAADDEQKRAWVECAAKMGENVIAREGEVMQFLLTDFDRVTYLGSGSFGGLAQEAQLKILELAHGLVATSYDTSMGYRHGPKSFVDDKTLVFVFVSNDPYTRQYDLDILNEIKADGICRKIIAIQQDAGELFSGEAFTFTGFEALPAAYLMLPFIMVGQTVSLLNSIRVGNTPDTPSPSGTVNRVVKGVTIHPFTA